MLTIHLSCPRCHRNLRCHRLIPPGERLRCPHCSGVFRAGIDDAPQRVAAPSHAGPSHGRSILLAWLLFVNLLLLVGVGIAILVATGKRASSQEAELAGPAFRPDRIVDVRADTISAKPERPADGETAKSDAQTEKQAEKPAHPADRQAGKPDLQSTTPPAPIAPPSKPAPGLAPPRKSSANPPEPPPLPKPQQRPAEKPAEPEKPQVPAAPRREEPAASWLPAQVQKQVDRSLENGVEFLRRRQRADGSWGNSAAAGAGRFRFTPGITALCALTLLECGVTAKDAQVRSAAEYLRQHMADITTTYSIGVAILFFDRLGDRDDAARIRTLALRLMAGQKPSGGWDYHCPKLNEQEELGLLALLYIDRPTNPAELFAHERNKDLSPEIETKRKEAKLDSELYRPRPSKVPPLELFMDGGRSAPSAKHKPATASEDSEEKQEARPERKTENREQLPGDSRRLTRRALEAAERLPEALQKTPALHSAELLRTLPDLDEPRTDNSNTQFAILGLLTAENYDVPMERAMALVDWRFRNSMIVQGGWEYRPGASRPGTKLPAASPLSMTAAALLGLALKHGLLLPNRDGRGRDVVVHDDEIIHRGFFTLTGMLQQYYASFALSAMPLENLDLYCLWTIERVAVLYNQRTLGDLEWYPTGVQLLLPLQRADGSWNPKGTYCLDEPTVSSSFALLFLKRSNLARGLTERLKTPQGQ